MLNSSRLRALHAFASHGTIAAAAQSLGYSAAAVSQQLAALERDTGTALLERSARSAALTPAGRVLAAHATEILDVLETAQSKARAAANQLAGEINVSAIPTAAALLAPVLADFMSTHPEVKVVLHQLSPTRAREHLRSRDLDLAVLDVWQPGHEPDIATVQLARDPLLLALPITHPQAARGPANLHDLVEALHAHTLLCAPRDQPSRAFTEKLLDESQARPAAVWELEGLATIARLVADGVGVALLPQLALADVDASSLATRPLCPARHRKLVAQTRQASRDDPVVHACITRIKTMPWQQSSTR